MEEAAMPCPRAARSRVAALVAAALFLAAPVFAQVPSFQRSWGSPGGSQPIAVAPDGSLLVGNGLNEAAIYHYSTAGALLARLTMPSMPLGIAIRPTGDFYAAFDYTNAVGHFDAGGSLIGYLGPWNGAPGSANGQFYECRALALDAQGNLYVGDYGNSRIQKFGPDGAFITKWGSYGSGPGQFNGVTGVAIDAAGDVYVADTNNNRIEKFTGDGQYVSQWPSTRPVSVAVSRYQTLYVTNGQTPNEIDDYTLDGVAIGFWGGRKLNYQAWGVAVDAAGTTYVTFSKDGSVQAFALGATPTLSSSWGALKALYR
jgi:hypothetical protein